MSHRAPDCRLARRLQDIDRQGHATARAALRIIDDMHSDYIASIDTDSLANLLIEMSKDGYPDLLDCTERNRQDCPVCMALARRLSQA
jgi:hypothetical protein